jgi:histidine ammonia-lyase
MATHGARRLLGMSANLRAVVAIELLVASQGIDFRRPLQTSAPLRRAHAALRTLVPFATQDRLLAEDIDSAAQALRMPAIQSLAGFLLPSLR